MAVLPYSLSFLPGQRGQVIVDALTGILRAMRLSGGVFLDADLTEPWCLRAQVDGGDCRPFGIVPTRLIAYHYVLEGRLFLSLDGHAPIEATAGRLLVLSRNDVHMLGSAVDLAPTDAGTLIEPAGEDGLGRIRFGGGGARTRILCGFLGTDGRSDPLTADLPAVMDLDLRDRVMGPWIEGSMRYAAHELAVGGEGASSSLAGLAELLFAEAIRGYLKTLPLQANGWLAGLRDPYVSRALSLMHARPERPWSLDEVAQQVGLSRSAFSARFVRLVRTSPMQYLGRQRLQRAADRLRDSSISIGRIASEVGYESEASFTRAFKREFGVAPGAYRRSRGPADGGSGHA
jgi:AraC-like DNA-binding protein